MDVDLEGASVISVAALILSGLALLVDVALWRRTRPRVAVMLRKDTTVYVGSHIERVFHVTVVNGGSAAVTVNDVGFVGDDPAMGDVTVDRLRRSGHEVIGPALPHRIDGDGVEDWGIDGRHLSRQFPEGANVHAVVARYGTRGFLRRGTTYREVRSREHEIVPGQQD